MAKILALTVVQHPTRYTPVVLHPGDDLPAWAADLVTNPEVVGDQAGADPSEEGTGQTETGSETSDDPSGTEGSTEGATDRPDDTWKNDDIRAFAEANEIDLGKANSKADMLQVIHDMLDFIAQETETEGN